MTRSAVRDVLTVIVFFVLLMLTMPPVFRFVDWLLEVNLG